VTDELFKALNIDAVYGRFGHDKKEPDTIYKIGDKTVGVEIATVY